MMDLFFSMNIVPNLNDCRAELRRVCYLGSETHVGRGAEDPQRESYVTVRQRAFYPGCRPSKGRHHKTP